MTPQQRLNAGMMSTKYRMFAISEKACRQIDQLCSPRINLDKFDRALRSLRRPKGSDRFSRN